ncbi:MAG: bifunctional [glutamate--ammonia ligase]-adenylyl-L-tyrosine phosphorylase/[glutamate--ammonia-ligase] adenylyltransferase [Rhodocyclaceae bacterium]
MPAFDELLHQTAAYSRFFASQLIAHPWLGERIGGCLDRPLSKGDMLAFLDEQGALTEETLGPRLRHLRSWVYGHLMVRDLAGLAPLAEVTSAMTMLADVAVTTAQRVIATRLSERFGLPRRADGGEQEMVVIGMGKLGGGELNVSSDIDLIFAYPEDVDTDGDRSIGAFEFYTKLGRGLINALAERTADGFVFRVDMRLRPNGDSGPLVASFDMLENYFITQGREWERYAWIKARPMTGGADEELLSIARPFVFRKYLDYGAINAMRALHAQIRQEVARREMADNIKLGPGGIREIEFMAQVFQLIRGGRDRELQQRPTLKVLSLLPERGLMPETTVQELAEAYEFLRRLEHRIQYMDDAQTHMLPSSSEDRERLAHSMGFADYAALDVVLEAHRARVAAHFEAVFSDPAAGEHELDEAWSGAGDTEPTCAVLERLNYSDASELAQRLQGFRQSPRFRAMSDDSRQRLASLMPRVLELCARQPNAHDTLTRMLDLLEAICRRAAYLALLQQYPMTLQRVIELTSASSWAARFLTRHPLLLDELLDARELGMVPDWQAFAQDLRARLDEHGDDVEQQMDLMREAHHAQVFRLLNQDIAGQLTVEKLSDHLSALADVVLEETLHVCWRHLAKRHRDAPSFIVVGYGKLGGKELGYASDLDIVFLHDDPHPDAQATYARLAQRINTWLSSQTPAGLLFETDLRLRPNGDSGLLVSSMEAFEKYQRESAWVWEHQALTRARFCAGKPELGTAFERMRGELLSQPRDMPKLREEVLAMRKKMRDAFANKGEGFELKHDAGGLIDVEFVVQFLVLAYASQWPELLGNIGNIALLRLAANVGLIPADTAHNAADAYRDLRRAQHALRLNEKKSRIFDDSMETQRAAVNALWRCVFEVI